jgi:tyrosyl-tRNA synthetase
MKIEEFKQNQIDSMFTRESINKKLLSGRQLIVKSGIDPTSIDIHFGHVVGLLILKQFIDKGHKVVFVIGDFTAQLGNGGDRPVMGLQETKKNSRTVIKFISQMLGTKNVQIVRQSEWFENMKLENFLKDLSLLNVKKLLRHNTFSERLISEKTFKGTEIVYPLMMALDSVILKPDIEIGSIEQKFNLQFTRNLMRMKGLPPEDFIINKRLPGIDGAGKMSKSKGNFIGVFEPIERQISKLMKIPDSRIQEFWTLLSLRNKHDITSLIAENKDILSVKKMMVKDILNIVHGKKINEKLIEDAFKLVNNPKLIVVEGNSLSLIKFIRSLDIVQSNRQVHTLIKQNAVKVNSQRVDLENQDMKLANNDLVSVGKKLFQVRVKGNLQTD